MVTLRISCQEPERRAVGSSADRVMTSIPDFQLVTRLLTAALLGALIGLEREMKQKSAGLRTNILIAVGAALFTIMSYEFAEGGGADPGRLAAQVVTGIGFLGAGAIMRNDSGVQGLTTAATVWVNAAVGVAAGGGKYHLALIATAVTLAALVILQPVERFMAKRFRKLAPQPTPANDRSPAN
jgi:putative Mg2+ transporter-C (MgtC) family protein